MRDKTRGFDIFLVSFAMLLLEIALIRWISTEVRIFAYVNNLVLLACFIGIGLGCFFSKRKINLWLTFLMLSILLIAISMPFTVNVRPFSSDIKKVSIHIFRDTPLLLSVFTDYNVWYNINAYSLKNLISAVAVGITSTLFVFLIILTMFIPLGQLLGSLLDRHENTIAAYSINIGASICGIWFFNGLSFAYCPPWLWFASFLAVSLYFVGRSKINILSCLICSLAIISMIYIQPKEAGHSEIWSPYQKLDFVPFMEKGLPHGGLLRINNVGYMLLKDLSGGFIKSHTEEFDYEMRRFGHYDIPYSLKKGAKYRVLIVGAGAGNDAAGALRNNAEYIDAVEIDPGIYKLGLTLHPEKPYSDPRVNVIIDDARAFFKKSKEKYDLISFGLLDSHVLVSSYNNIRLDNYVYTKESFEEAKKLLTDGGVLTIIFEVARPWIGHRLYGLIREVFGQPPIAFKIGDEFGWGGVMFVVSNDMKSLYGVIDADLGLKQFIDRNRVDYSQAVKLTTDDWPYLYLEKPSIPSLHLCIIFILLALLLISKRALIPGGQTINMHFFFLGAAFLLLEFQNVSKTALLFGTTWIVNSIVISAILLLALAANLAVVLFRIKNTKALYLCIFAAILVSYFTPLKAYNTFVNWQKMLLASFVLNLPVFFSGIIFINSFKDFKSKGLAFGSNFYGAVTGGLIETGSFIMGVNNLLLVTAFFYFLSYLSITERSVI